MSAGRVTRVEAVKLSVVDRPWGWAVTNSDAIDAHWARRRGENPAFFNGVLHVLADMRQVGGRFEADLLRTDFKSFLAWRDGGTPAEAGVRDIFGSALIRSAEGHVLLGRQRSGNINGGLAYLPGGFIDDRDVAADGSVDIDASIARELAEETGLVAEHFRKGEGYRVTEVGAMVSIAAEFRGALPSERLRADMLAHVANDPDPELADVIVVRDEADLSGLGMPEYASVLMPVVLAETRRRSP